MYTDPMFPPNGASICGFGEKRDINYCNKIPWKRVKELFPNQKITVYEYVTPDDII